MSGFFPNSALAVVNAGPSLVPRCGSCGLFKHCKSPKMPLYGQGRRRIFICGEGPGETEDERNAPFVGKAGQHLRRTLDKLGVDLERDCWVYNSVICRPKNSEGRNRAPSDKEIGYCRPNVIRQIKELRPDVVIPLGGPAVQSILGWLWREKAGSIGRWVGWSIPCQSINAWVCPTYHPSAAIRGLDNDDPVVDLFFRQHLETALKHEGRPHDPVPDYGRRIKIVNDDREAARWIDGMAEGGRPVAFDLETSTLKPDGPLAEIICCSVSDGRVSVAYPWQGRAIAATERLVCDSDVPKIASNKKFETRWTMREFGRPVKNWGFCTMLASHVLDNRQGITSIKFQAFVQLGVDVWDGPVSPYLKSGGGNTKNKIREADLQQLLLYCGLDSLYEWLVAKKQCKQLGLDLFERK